MGEETPAQEEYVVNGYIFNKTVYGYAEYLSGKRETDAAGNASAPVKEDAPATETPAKEEIGAKETAAEKKSAPAKDGEIGRAHV